MKEGLQVVCLGWISLPLQHRLLGFYQSLGQDYSHLNQVAAPAAEAAAEVAAEAAAEVVVEEAEANSILYCWDWKCQSQVPD